MFTTLWRKVQLSSLPLLIRMNSPWPALHVNVLACRNWDGESNRVEFLLLYPKTIQQSRSVKEPKLSLLPEGSSYRPMTMAQNIRLIVRLRQPLRCSDKTTADSTCADTTKIYRIKRANKQSKTQISNWLHRQLHLLSTKTITTVRPWDRKRKITVQSMEGWVSKRRLVVEKGAEGSLQQMISPERYQFQWPSEPWNNRRTRQLKTLGGRLLTSASHEP